LQLQIEVLSFRPSATAARERYYHSADYLFACVLSTT